MPIRGSVGNFEQFLLNMLKIARHLRAEIRQRTARENKRNSDGVAFELAGADCLAELVGKMIFRQGIADLQRLYVPAEMKHTGFRWQLVRIGF